MGTIKEILMQLAKDFKKYLEKKRYLNKINWLKKNGMVIGKDVYLPMSTWIDASHCYLISIGNNCVFGPSCKILAHDASMNEHLNIGKIGIVKIEDKCFIGYGTIILPGVHIGANSIIAAYSVITKDVPKGSVVAGNPAKVVNNVKNFYDKHIQELQLSPAFPFNEYGSHILTQVKRKEILDKLENSQGKIGYIVGGYSALSENNEYEYLQ